MIMTHRLFVLSVMTAAVCACQTVPQTTASDTLVLASPNVPMTAYPLEPPVVLDNPDTPQTIELAPSVAQIGWKSFYADEKLKALIELGLANNKNLQQAMIGIQKLQSNYQITSTQAFPTVGLSAGLNRSGNQLGQATQYNVGLGLASYELEFWGKVANLKEQALQNYLASNAAKDSLQIGIIANIAQTYANLSYANAQLMLAQSTVKSREHALFITQKRFEAGIDSKSPSLQADSSLESARLSMLEAQTNLQKAKNALQLLVGLPIPDELMPEPAITHLVAPKVLSAGLPSELLYYRPDILKAEHELKAAGANIAVAKAAFFPSIRLNANLGTASAELSDLFKGASGVWSFAPSIHLPIFDAGARQAAYEISQLDQQQKLMAYENAIQTAFREVNDVLAQRATLDEQLALQYKLQSNYQRSYDIAYATFRSGLSGYLDVLDAERSLFAVQQTILQMELQKVLSQIALYQVLGGGADLTVAQITQSQAQSMMPARLATKDELALSPQSSFDAIKVASAIQGNAQSPSHSQSDAVGDETLNAQPSDTQPVGLPPSSPKSP